MIHVPGHMRWHLAKLFDKFQDTCWAELVVWALYPENHPFMELFELRHSAGRCGARGEHPYCGKCLCLWPHYLDALCQEEERVEFTKFANRRSNAKTDNHQIHL